MARNLTAGDIDELGSDVEFIMQIRTLRVRVKDKHAKLLRQMAFEVNKL